MRLVRWNRTTSRQVYGREVGGSLGT
jgi:hypothetical protein